MIAYIKGILKEATALSVILDVHGIGYKIYTPVNIFSRLPQIEETLFLHTSFVIRENSQTLYGFLSPKERDLFEALQDVSGIGPKVSLAIVGNSSVKSLQEAIHRHDIAAISKIPGIGKKTAERLIIEMRDKISVLFPESDSQSDFQDHAILLPQDPKAQQVSDAITHDAMSALVNLGYNQMTAQKAIKKTLKELPEDNLDLGTLITTALQNIN